VAAGKTGKFPVKEELIHWQKIAILPADVGQLDYYSKTGAIPKEVREVLTKAIKIKGEMVDLGRQIKTREQKIAQIRQDQVPIRENIKVVEKSPELYGKWSSKLGDQENQVTKLQNEIEALNGQFETKQKELEDYLGGTNVE